MAPTVPHWPFVRRTTLQVGIEKPCCLLLVSGEKMAVAVERDGDARMSPCRTRMPSPSPLPRSSARRRHDEPDAAR